MPIPGLTAQFDNDNTTLSFSFTCQAGDLLLFFAAIATAGLGTPGPDTWTLTDGPDDIFNDEYYLWTRVADGTETTLTLTGLFNDFCNGILVIAEQAALLLVDPYFNPPGFPVASITTDVVSATGANVALEVIASNVTGPASAPSGTEHLINTGAGPFDDDISIFTSVISGTGGGHTFNTATGGGCGSSVILLQMNFAKWTIGRTRRY